MNKLTVVIPSRAEPDRNAPDEQFLSPTVADLFAKAHGEVEVIVALDGYWPTDEFMPAGDKRLRYVHWGKAGGMRRGIDAAAAISTGNYLMKTDSHCMFRDGYDLALIEASQRNWVQIPRRYSLNPEAWTKYKHPRDYMYLSYPDNPNDWGGKGFHGREWRERDKDKELQKIDLDQTMSFQGSCWFMPLDYFYHLGLMDSENYGPFYQEAQDIGMKVFLDGGRIMRNKRTWYAHLHKGSRGRGFFLNASGFQQPVEATKKLVRENREKLEPIFESFQPLPGWPDDWKDKIF